MIVSALKSGADIYVGFDANFAENRVHIHRNFHKTDTSLLALTGKPNILDIAKNLFVYSETTRETMVEFTQNLHEAIPERYGDYSMLVASQGGILFEISNENIFEIEDFTAIGTGYEYALGALFASKSPPRLRVEESIRAASRFQPECGGGIHVERL